MAQDGDNILFDFTGSYTPQDGDNILFNFTSSGLGLQDFDLDISVEQIVVEDVPLDISAYSQFLFDFKVDIRVVFNGISDLFLDILVGTLVLSDFNLDVACSRQVFFNLSLDLIAVTGLLTDNLFLDLSVSNGNYKADFTLDVMAITQTQAFKAIYGIQLNSVLTDIT